MALTLTLATSTLIFAEGFSSADPPNSRGVHDTDTSDTEATS
jgi:hypothetical protein